MATSRLRWALAGLSLLGVLGVLGVLSASSAQAQVTCFGIADTDPLVCSGHGTCVATDTCACDVGYSGVDCSVGPLCSGIPAGDPDVCSGHGTCVAPDTCACEVGFTGPDCEVSSAVPLLPWAGRGALGLLLIGALLARRRGVASAP